MIKKLLVPIALALAACGGPSSNAGTAQFQAASPQFSDVSLTQSDADGVEPAESAQASDINLDSTAATATDCHPHLFVRTHEVVERMNRHFAKQLRHIERVIKENPSLADGQTHVWENVENGIDRKLTMTRTTATGSVSYTWELDLKTTAAGSAFVKVGSGTLTVTGGDAADTAAVRERKGSARFDYSALKSVVTTEKASGQVQVDFDIVKDPSKPAPSLKKTSVVTLTSFLPEEGDAHAPRTGSYTHISEPGVGGLLSFTTSVVLLCPTNTAGAAADVTAVARWYKASTGSIHGRSDAQATGGQIASGHRWVGVTCAEGQTATAPAEGYWLMKEEDAGGVTVSGSVTQDGAGACDPVFGALPNLTSSANDYSFSSTASFPGQW